MSMSVGLKVLSNEVWYGGGYCGICGDTEVVPRAVRWWCPDDGWRMGVLCQGCTLDAEVRGPKPDDFAYDRHYGEHKTRGNIIDLSAEYTDLDATYSDFGGEV